MLNMEICCLNFGRSVQLKGVLTGHGGAVTSISVPANDDSFIVTGSRGEYRFRYTQHLQKTARTAERFSFFS